jgi:prepilin-type N-terminal cleavage/methylation domain-containing protein
VRTGVVVLTRPAAARDLTRRAARCDPTRRAAARRDGGFTLIELLVAIAILGVITVPLTGVIMGYFLNSATTSARLGESHDEQIAAAYWQQDVASVGVRAPYDQGTGTFPLQQSVGTAFPCSVPGGTSTVVVLAWNRYDSAGAATRISVAYLTATAGTETRLLRLQCSGTALDSTAVLAHDLDPATPPVPTCTGSAGASCAAYVTAVPVTVSLRLAVKDPSGRGQPYTVTLTGMRRQT